MKKNAVYDPSSFENRIYKFWKENNLFEPIKKNKDSKNFCIILPPPNVTGHLHLGHAWDGSLQDAMIRYKKLKGFRALWIPGTDHAGIATQTKFEQVLKQNGENIKVIPRNQFLKRLYKWSIEQKKYIHAQWARMGLCLSYKNEAYTLDENVSELVNSTFKKLYDDKLIYQGYKIVNWDIKLQTAISDIEVVHKSTKSKMYHFKYQVTNTNEFIKVATTRPETMFVDVAVFVNPNDERYKKYINMQVINPINDKLIPILTDTYVDSSFGTGAMKCTPAHDFNDYKLAIKYQIECYQSVINQDGTLNENANLGEISLKGIDRLQARNKIVEYIKSKGLLIKTEDYENEIGYSERTGEIVEPLLSEQWFVKMKPLAKQTIVLIKKQKPEFIPLRFEKTMQQWLNNIEDWCISRQLKWGHQIPVWYSNKTNEKIVGIPPINIKDYVQDTSVLDTWFSSGLWPLALTKHSQTSKLSDFYPISMLVTGYDILFFWVARMFFLCGYLSKSVPIKSLFFHGLIRDSQNRKMSKSLNNGVDPIDVINKYGADALHMFLVSTATVGEDLRYDEKKIEYCWNFINKLWNANNYISTHKQVTKAKITHVINKWIVNEFNKTNTLIQQQMDKYNFVVAFKHITEFVWESFCNKYLEYVKKLFFDKRYIKETIYTINSIYKNILIMLHPYAPFVTEQIYMQHNKKSIMLEKWPKNISTMLSPNEKQLIQYFVNIVSVIRDLRIKHSIKQAHVIKVNIINNKKIDVNKINQLLDKHNIKIEKLISKTSTNDNLIITNNLTLEYINDFMSQAQNLDVINKKIIFLQNEVKRSENILSNQNFINKAPIEKVNLEKQKLNDYQKQLDELITIVNSTKN